MDEGVGAGKRIAAAVMAWPGRAKSDKTK